MLWIPCGLWVCYCNSSEASAPKPVFTGGEFAPWCGFEPRDARSHLPVGAEDTTEGSQEKSVRGGRGENISLLPLDVCGLCRKSEVFIHSFSPSHLRTDTGISLSEADSNSLWDTERPKHCCAKGPYFNFSIMPLKLGQSLHSQETNL